MESSLSRLHEAEKSTPIRKSLSDELRGQIAEELKGLEIEPKIHLLQKQRCSSDSVEPPKPKSKRLLSDNLDRDLQEPSVAASSCPTDMDAHMRMEDAEDDEDGKTPGLIRNVGNLRLGRLRRSWRQRANTLGGTLAQGTHAVVQGTQSIGGSLIQGTQAVGRTFSLGAKAVARVPQNIVNMSTGIFMQPEEEGGNTTLGPDGLPIPNEFNSEIEDIDETVRDARRLRRQQQLDVLHRLKKKTAEMRENVILTFA